MRNQGFTVIEILIVLAILSLGAALIYPHFNNPIKWTTQKCNQVNLSSLNNGLRILQLKGYSDMLVGNNDLEHHKRILDLLSNPPWGESVMDTTDIQANLLTSVGSGATFAFDKYNNEQSTDQPTLNNFKQPRYPKAKANKSWGNKTFNNSPNDQKQEPEQPEVDLTEVEKLADLVFKRNSYEK